MAVVVLIAGIPWKAVPIPAPRPLRQFIAPVAVEAYTTSFEFNFLPSMAAEIHCPIADPTVPEPNATAPPAARLPKHAAPAALVATGVGGVAGGALICAGANSMIGSYVSEATGGSSIAGWVGGMITGAACGTGAGLAGNLLVQAATATGAAG